MSTSTIRETTNDADDKRRWPVGYIAVILLAFVLLAYVLSAPILHDSSGFPFRFQMPVWSAARQGPFSKLLKPYFKLWGVEFPRSQPNPPATPHQSLE
jgi:hypothetical protein